MANYDEDLKALQGKILRKRDLETAIKDLSLKRDDLARQVAELEKIKQDEQKDVYKLEKGGVKSFFYGVTGKKGKKLDKEREEARVATKRYEEALYELESLKEQISVKEKEMENLESDEKKYEELIRKKRKQIYESGDSLEEKLSDIEEKLSILKDNQDTIIRTIGTGAQILEETKGIRAVLDRAENSAVVQSAFKPMAFDKYHQMGEAQNHATTLKNEMEMFGEGLKSVIEDSDMQVNLDSFYQFGNFIFSYWVKDTGTIMEVASIERIRASKGNLKLLDNEVKKGIDQLTERQQVNEKEIISLENNLETLIINAG